MRARLLVVMKIASQSAPQRSLAPHDDVIQALAANGSDQSFHIWVLPRRSRRRDHFFDSMLFVMTTNSPPKSHLYPGSDTLALRPRETLLASAAPSTLRSDDPSR